MNAMVSYAGRAWEDEAPMFPGAPPHAIGPTSIPTTPGRSVQTPRTTQAVAEPVTPRSVRPFVSQSPRRMSTPRQVSVHTGRQEAGMEMDDGSTIESMFPESVNRSEEFRSRALFQGNTGMRGQVSGGPLSYPTDVLPVNPLSNRSAAQQAPYLGSPKTAQSRGGLRRRSSLGQVGLNYPQLKGIQAGRISAYHRDQYFDDATIESLEPTSPYLESSLMQQKLPNRRNSAPCANYSLSDPFEAQRNCEFVPNSSSRQHKDRLLAPETIKTTRSSYNEDGGGFCACLPYCMGASDPHEFDNILDKLGAEESHQYGNSTIHDARSYSRNHQPLANSTLVRNTSIATLGNDPHAEAKQQIMLELKQAVEMRVQAIDASDVQFWDGHIDFLNNCIMKLSSKSSSREIVPYNPRESSQNLIESGETKDTRVKIKSPGDLPGGYVFKARQRGRVILVTVRRCYSLDETQPRGGVRKGEIFFVPLVRK